MLNISRKAFFVELLLRGKGVLYQDEHTVDQYAKIDNFDLARNLVWISDVRQPLVKFAKPLDKVWFFLNDDNDEIQLEIVVEQVGKWVKNGI